MPGLSEALDHDQSISLSPFKFVFHILYFDCTSISIRICNPLADAWPL